MRSLVIQSGLAPIADTSPGSETQDIHGENEQDEHAHLDLEGLDLLAEVFGRASHHQTSNEDGDDDEHQHAVEAGPNPAEDDFTQLDIEERNQSPQGRERIVHRVDRAAGGVRGDGGEERRVEDSEPNFLALHIAIGGIDAQLGEDGIAHRFVMPADEERRDKENRHRSPDRPTVTGTFHHPAQVIGQRAGNGKD